MRAMQPSYIWQLGQQVFRQIWSFGRDQIVGLILAVLIFVYQVRAGLIQGKDLRSTELATVAWPYLTLLGMYVFIEIVRAPFVLRREAEAERRRPLRPPSQLQKQELRREVIAWLESHLAARHAHVGRVFLYGSIVHDHYPSADVDVVILFRPRWEWTVRRGAIYLHEKIRSAFRQRFGIPLHPKFFLASEEALLAGYLERAGKSQEVILSSGSSTPRDS